MRWLNEHHEELKQHGRKEMQTRFMLEKVWNL
jgi:hypothetical protein